MHACVHACVWREREREALNSVATANLRAYMCAYMCANIYARLCDSLALFFLHARMHTELLLVRCSRGNFSQNPAHDLACACMHVCMYSCMHVCMHACMYAYMHARMHACVHACTCVWLYVCACVCTRVRACRYDQKTKNNHHTRRSHGPRHPKKNRMHSISRRAFTCTLGVLS